MAAPAPTHSPRRWAGFWFCGFFFFKSLGVILRIRTPTTGIPRCPHTSTHQQFPSADSGNSLQIEFFMQVFSKLAKKTWSELQKHLFLLSSRSPNTHTRTHTQFGSGCVPGLVIQAMEQAAKTSKRTSQAPFHWPPYAAYGPGTSQHSVLTLLEGIGDPVFSNTPPQGLH